MSLIQIPKLFKVVSIRDESDVSLIHVANLLEVLYLRLFPFRYKILECILLVHTEVKPRLILTDKVKLFKVNLEYYNLE